MPEAPPPPAAGEGSAGARRPVRPDRRHLDDVFGDVLPSQTGDDRPDDDDGGTGSGVRDDDWWQRQRPPHHG